MSELEFSLCSAFIFGGPLGLLAALFTSTWPIWLACLVGYAVGALATGVLLYALIEAEVCVCHFNDWINQHKHDSTH